MAFWIEIGAGSCAILWALYAITRGIIEMRARLKELADESPTGQIDENGNDKVA